MTKKRNVTKPQGTLSSEDVTKFYLGMWALRDAIETGNLQKINAAYMELWDVVPSTTTNDGARTRARNIRRKQETLEQLAKEQAKPNRQFEDLSPAEQEEVIAKLEAYNRTLLANGPAIVRFDLLDDDAQVDQLKALWG